MAVELLAQLRLLGDRGRDLRPLNLPLRDGGKLHARQLGPAHGRPVVLLHGFCGTWRQMLAAARAIGGQRRLVLIDARGHGASTAFVGKPTMARLADDLSEVLATLSSDAVDVVGLSMGAQTVFEYVRRHGTARLGKLVLIDQGPRLRAAPGWPHALFGGMDDTEVAQALETLAHRPRALGRAWLRGVWRSGESLPVRMALTPQFLAGLPGTRADTLRLAHDMLDQDWREVVPHIDRPALLCYGGRSMYPDAGRWMHAHLPGSQLEWFAKSGHGLMFQEPARFGQVVGRFLN